MSRAKTVAPLVQARTGDSARRRADRLHFFLYD
jgi:hypothetical protein